MKLDVFRKLRAPILTDFRVTLFEGIADQRRRAAAERAVIDRLAHRLAAAHVLRARIPAFVLYASLVARTIRAKHALRMAAGDTRRDALQPGQTLANCCSTDFLADGVRATRRRIAWISFSSI